MNNDQQPTVAEGKVPTWIKIMWVFGVLWVIVYIFLGLMSNPIAW